MSLWTSAYMSPTQRHLFPSNYGLIFLFAALTSTSDFVLTFSGIRYSTHNGLPGTGTGYASRTRRLLSSSSVAGRLCAASSPPANRYTSR